MFPYILGYFYFHHKRISCTSEKQYYYAVDGRVNQKLRRVLFFHPSDILKKDVNLREKGAVIVLRTHRNVSEATFSKICVSCKVCQMANVS